MWPVQAWFLIVNSVFLEILHILQRSSRASSQYEQVQLIMDAIADIDGVRACTLFRKNKQGNMVAACRGHYPVIGRFRIIPAGKGLIGLVADGLHPIKIDSPTHHPAYYHKEDYGRRIVFFGIPLVKLGDVVGVLVMEITQIDLFAEDDESFLFTLGSHLALIVAEMTLPRERVSGRNLVIPGGKGASGVGIGRVRLSLQSGLHDIPDTRCDDIEAAITEWQRVVQSVSADLRSEQALLSSEVDDPVRSIFDAYLMILSDPALSERVEIEIRSGYAIPSALRNSIDYFANIFKAMDDPYLKTRSEDILHLGNKLFSAWRGDDMDRPGYASGERVILVGKYISVSEIARIPLRRLAGIVCMEGSTLSHTAVLASALGVPAVMGVSGLKTLNEGELAIIDGDVGQVISQPTPMVINEYRQLLAARRGLQKTFAALSGLPAATEDGTVIQLLANTGLLADISPGLKNGAEGIGLYRTEVAFMVRESFPSEDEQTELYRSVLSSYAGKPVYMRTLDIGGDKPLPYFDITKEENPALGWRGIRFTLDNIHILMIQFRAMLRAAEGLNNLHVLLPMVSASRELKVCRKLLQDACEQLRAEGVEVIKPKMGIMVEVPAAISQIRFWKDQIDFISIGSNDLSQYLLALDRNNGRVANCYDHVHPAVLYEINRIVNIAREYQLPVSLCGEMASDPVAVLILIGMGVRRLSLSSSSLPKIKWLIRSVPISLAEDILKKALDMDSIENIRQLGHDALCAQGLGQLLSDNPGTSPPSVADKLK